MSKCSTHPPEPILFLILLLSSWTDLPLITVRSNDIIVCYYRSHITSLALGDQPNSNSNGLAAGHNTDGFDASTENLTIQNSVIMNQVPEQSS